MKEAGSGEIESELGQSESKNFSLGTDSFSFGSDSAPDLGTLRLSFSRVSS